MGGWAWCLWPLLASSYALSLNKLASGQTLDLHLEFQAGSPLLKASSTRADVSLPTGHGGKGKSSCVFSGGVPEAARGGVVRSLSSRDVTSPAREPVLTALLGLTVSVDTEAWIPGATKQRPTRSATAYTWRKEQL
jgi:hypothetical protein